MMTCTGLSAAQNPSEFTTFLRLGNEVGDAPAAGSHLLHVRERYLSVPLRVGGLRSKADLP